MAKGAAQTAPTGLHQNWFSDPDGPGDGVCRGHQPPQDSPAGVTRGSGQQSGIAVIQASMSSNDDRSVHERALLIRARADAPTTTRGPRRTSDLRTGPTSERAGSGPQNVRPGPAVEGVVPGVAVAAVDHIRPTPPSVNPQATPE
jgi:hypothetical protein